MIHVTLKPAMTQAWKHLQTLSDDDLRKRPTAALARLMKIGLRDARRHIHALRAQKLIRPSGAHGIIVISAAPGSDLQDIADAEEVYGHQTQAAWRYASDGWPGATPVTATKPADRPPPSLPVRCHAPDMTPTENAPRRIGFVIPEESQADSMSESAPTRTYCPSAAATARIQSAIPDTISSVVLSSSTPA
ncbi:MAG: hypothetical protein M0R22_13640, partial [Dehalococcoidia bacterium]|nr:hypothetical protein [Dehalococcoidia bacterium]